MEPNLKESLFEEAFKIITINKNKANSLRQSSLKNNKDDNLEIIKYLGELEYDLKTIYDILKDLKLAYFNKQTNLEKPKSNNKNIKEEKKYTKKDIKKNNKEIFLKNDFDYKIEGNNKTYVMTSNQFEDNRKNNNIIDYFINSYPRRGEYNNKIPRSMSCKSYIGNWNSNSIGLNPDNFNNNYNYKKNIRDLEYRNYFDNKFIDNNNTNGSISKDKTFKLNFDYDAYLTDYSLNRTNKNDLNNSDNDFLNNNLNNSKQNLNLSDLKNEKDYDLNNKFNVPLQKKIIGNSINNYKINNINENQYNKGKENENENNNIFTFSEPKSNNILNINDYNITFESKNRQNFNNINSNAFDKNKITNNKNFKNNLEDNNINNKNINFKNDKDGNVSNTNFIYNNENSKLNPYNFEENNRNLNQNINNRQIYINNKQLNNKKDNNDDYDSDEELQEQKKEIIKSIISEIIQDKSKLDILKKELGDNIGQKLLNGNISEEELYKVAEVLKNNQINNNKKFKNKYSKKKFNQPSDKILLKESINNKRYNFREFPRGWNSTKDYFVNNGSTFLKSNRGQK